MNTKKAVLSVHTTLVNIVYCTLAKTESCDIPFQLRLRNYGYDTHCLIGAAVKIECDRI